MTHPEELLAGYVDGTLSSEDRAVVDAHLSSCERCRREVAQARVAVAALGGLPEAPAPSGLGARAMAELGSGGGVPKTTSAPRWQRWAAPAAAAAAILLVATLVLPKIGGGGATSADGASASAPVTAVGSGTATLELSSENFQPDTLGALASDAVAKLAAGAAGVQTEASGAGSPARTAGPGAAAKATACIREAFQQVPGTPVRLIEAKFQGQPAYIGFYAESPGVGQPVDALTVRVASVQGCEILHIAQVST